MRAIEREVVGQPRAVNAVARAVSLLSSGLPPGSSLPGPFLFVGPTGTGKTHLARVAACLLGGNQPGFFLADCAQIHPGEEWPSFIRQIEPFFGVPAAEGEGSLSIPGRPSVLVIRHLEWCRPEFARALIWALGSGFIQLSGGRRGSLAGWLIILTTNLCSREILEATTQSIGFSSAAQEEENTEKARIFQACYTTLERQWGGDALGRLEDIIVFHRWRPEQLGDLLDRQVSTLNRRLAMTGTACRLDETARRFLIERGVKDLRQGAWWMERAFRRFVEYPAADLMRSGQAPPGTEIFALHFEGDDRLKFGVRPQTEKPYSSEAGFGTRTR